MTWTGTPTSMIIVAPATGGSIDFPLPVTVQVLDQYSQVVNWYSGIVQLNVGGSTTMIGGGVLTISEGVVVASMVDSLAETRTLSLIDVASTGLNLTSTQSITFGASGTGAKRYLLLAPYWTGLTSTVVTILATNQYNITQKYWNQDVKLVSSSGSISGVGIIDIVNGIGYAHLTTSTAETVTLSMQDVYSTGLSTSMTAIVVFMTVACPPGTFSNGHIAPSIVSQSVSYSNPSPYIIDFYTSAYTITFWVRRTSNTQGTVFSMGSTSTSYGRCAVYFTNSSMITLDFQGTTMTAPSLVALNSWHFYTVTYENASPWRRAIWRDGVNIMQNVAGQAHGTAVRAVVQVGYSSSQGYFYGNLDELRVFSTVLSTSQIQQAFSNIFTPSVIAHERLYWSFGEQTGTSTNDGSGSGVIGAVSSSTLWSGVNNLCLSIAYPSNPFHVTIDGFNAPPLVNTFIVPARPLIKLPYVSVVPIVMGILIPVRPLLG
jgi:hypothetical protein